MNVTNLIRPEILHMREYSAPSIGENSGIIKLDANENPFNLPHFDVHVNRYPEQFPEKLTKRISEIYNLPTNNILVTRGSTEALDYCFRTFINPGIDYIYLPKPSFEYYDVLVQIAGASSYTYNLDKTKNFIIDADTILAGLKDRTKILLICSPNNPTASVLKLEELEKICIATKNRLIVLVDEAYIQFSSSKSALSLLDRYEHLVVTHTLSKAYSLADARLGFLFASPKIIHNVSKLVHPFYFPKLLEEAVLKATQGNYFSKAQENIATIIGEREKLMKSLANFKFFEKIYPSETNFILIESKKAKQITDFLTKNNILVRYKLDGKNEYVRITVGNPDENDKLLKTLEEFKE